MPSAPGLAPEVSSAVNAGVLSSPNTSSEAKRLIAQEAAKKLNRTDTKDIRHAEHGKRGNIWILSGLRKLGQEQVVDRVTGGQARRRSEATLYIKWYEGRHGRIPTVDEVRNGLSGADTVNHKLYTDNLRSRTQKEITAERHQSWKNAVSKDRIQVRNAAQVMQGGEMGAAVNRIVEEATKSGSLSPTQREALSRALSTGTAAERLRAQGVTAEDFVAGIEGMAARSQRDKIKVERATVSVQQHVEEALQSRIGKLANKVGKATIDKLVKIAESKLGKFLSKGSLAIAIGVIALHFIPPLGIAADILTIAGVGFSSMNAILTIGRVVGKARSLSGAIEFASAGNERFYMGGKSRHFIENSRGRKLQRKAQSHMHSVQHEYYDIYNKYFDADGNLLPNINPDNEAVQKDLLLLKARYDAANKFQADNTRKAWRHDTLSSQRSTPKELEKKVNEAERNLQSANARVGEFLKADTQQIEEAINRQLQKLNEELAQDKRIERRIVTNRVLFQVLLRAGGMGLAANEAATFASNLIQTHSVTDAVTGLHNPLETFGQYSQIGKLQTGISHLQADFQPHDAINYAMSSVDAHAANGITSTNTVDMHSSGVINPNDISRVSAMQELHGGTQISPDQWKTIQQALSDNPHGGGGVDSLKAAIDEAYKNGQGGPGGVSENALRHILEELSHGHNPPTGDELAKELQQAASHGGGDVKGLTPDQIMKLLHDHHVVPTMHNEAAQAGARFVNEQHTSTDVLGKVPATDTSSTQNIPPAGVPQIPTAGAPQIPTDTNQSGFDEVMHGVQKSWSEFAQNPGKTITDDFRSVFHLGPDANHAGVVGVGHNENVNVIDQFHHHTGTLETHANAGNMYGHDHFSIPTNHPEDASDRLLGTWQGAHTAYDPNGKWVEFYGTYPHAQMEVNIDGHYYTFQPGTMTLGSHDMLTLHPLDGGHDITMSQDNFLHMVGYGDQKSILAGYIINHDTQVWGQQHGWTLTHNASDRIAQYLNGQLGARHAGLDAMIQRDLTAHGISNGDIHYTAVPMGEALQNGHHITILAQNQYIDSAAFRGNVVEYIPGADSASDGAYQWLMYGAGIASTVAAIVGFGAGRSHNRATRFPFITQGPHPVLSDAYLGGTAALAAASFFVPPLALISGPALAGYIAGRISARHAQAPAQAAGTPGTGNTPGGGTPPGAGTPAATATPTATNPGGGTNPSPGAPANPHINPFGFPAAAIPAVQGAHNNRARRQAAQAMGITNPAEINAAVSAMELGDTHRYDNANNMEDQADMIARNPNALGAFAGARAERRRNIEAAVVAMGVPDAQRAEFADGLERAFIIHQTIHDNQGAGGLTGQALADAIIHRLNTEVPPPTPPNAADVIDPGIASRQALAINRVHPSIAGDALAAYDAMGVSARTLAVVASELALPPVHGYTAVTAANRVHAALSLVGARLMAAPDRQAAAAEVATALRDFASDHIGHTLQERITAINGGFRLVGAPLVDRVRVAAELEQGGNDAKVIAALRLVPTTRRGATNIWEIPAANVNDLYSAVEQLSAMGIVPADIRNNLQAGLDAGIPTGSPAGSAVELQPGHRSLIEFHLEPAATPVADRIRAALRTPELVAAHNPAEIAGVLYAIYSRLDAAGTPPTPNNLREAMDVFDYATLSAVDRSFLARAFLGLLPVPTTPAQIEQQAHLTLAVSGLTNYDHATWGADEFYTLAGVGRIIADNPHTIAYANLAELIRDDLGLTPAAQAELAQPATEVFATVPIHGINRIEYVVQSVLQLAVPHGSSLQHINAVATNMVASAAATSPAFTARDIGHINAAVTSRFGAAAIAERALIGARLINPSTNVVHDVLSAIPRVTAPDYVQAAYGLILGGQSYQDVTAENQTLGFGIPKVDVAAEAITYASTMGIIDQAEIARFVVSATGPNGAAAAQAVGGILEAQGYATPDIRQALALANLNRATKETIINDVLTRLITGPMNKTTLQEHIATAIALAGYPSPIPTRPGGGGVPTVSYIGDLRTQVEAILRGIGGINARTITSIVNAIA